MVSGFRQFNFKFLSSNPVLRNSWEFSCILHNGPTQRHPSARLVRVDVVGSRGARVGPKLPKVGFVHLDRLLLTTN